MIGSFVGVGSSMPPPIEVKRKDNHHGYCQGVNLMQTNPALMRAFDLVNLETFPGKTGKLGLTGVGGCWRVREGGGGR